MLVRLSVLAILLTMPGGALGAPGQVFVAPFRNMPSPGVRHYTYEVAETVNETVHKGYRTDFDLESRDGQLFAIVRATSELVDGSLKEVVPDAACRQQMGGTADSLARVKLYPIDPKTARDLGPSFLATCAPGAVFFPLTDILNVALIMLPGPFRTHELKKAGDILSFPGFEAAFDRSGERIHEVASGGEVKLVELSPERAVISWQPRPAALTIVQTNVSPPVTLEGTENWAFRVEIDRRTGELQRASTMYDELDMKIVGAPDSAPPLHIRRAVTIEPSIRITT